MKAQERAKDFSIEITIEDFVKVINNSKVNDFNLNEFHLTRIVISMVLNKIIFPKTNYSRRL